MTNPHNVDICVTCVSDKPPQLPLREELPSLGIEVVYNAHGVGAKASHQEQKRKLRQFQRKKLNGGKKKNQGLELLPFFRKSQKQEEEDQKREEDELRVPHALSYSNYQRRLQDQLEHGDKKKKKETTTTTTDPEGSKSSTTSWDDDTTHSTVESSKYGRENDEPLSPHMPTDRYEVVTTAEKPPIKSLEFPTHSAEDMALKEAFHVFAESSTPTTTVVEEGLFDRTESRENRSTLAGHGREAREPSGDRVVPPSTTLASQLLDDARDGQDLQYENPHYEPSADEEEEEEEDVQTPNDTLSTMKSIEELAATYLSRLPAAAVAADAAASAAQRNTATPTKSIGSRLEEASRPSDEGRQTPGGDGDTTIASKSVRVSHLNDRNDRGETEFYDLTAISDEDEASKITFDSNHSEEEEESVEGAETLTSSKDLSTVSSKKEPPMMRNPGIRVYPSAAIQEQLPGLRLRIPEEDDGYGRIVLDLSDVMEDHGPGSPLVYSPSSRYNNNNNNNNNGIHSDDRMSDIREGQNEQEERQDDDILDSPMRYSTSTSAASTNQQRDAPNGKFAVEAQQKLAASRRQRDKSIFDDSSSFGLSYSQRYTQGTDPEEDTVFHSDNTESRGKYEYRIQLDPDGNASHDDSFLPTASPKHLYHEETAADEDDDELSVLPSLKNVLSKDSECKSKHSVSFSYGIEERYYEEDDQMTTYEDVVNLVNEIQNSDTRLAGPSLNSDGNTDEAFPPLRSQSRLETERHRYSPNEEEQRMVDLAAPVDQLLEALSKDKPLPANSSLILARNPEIASHPLPGRSIYPLHAACARALPNRFEDGEPCLVKDLVRDIVERKMLIEALVLADPSACQRLDKRGDLPVHIISRQMMEWEAKWYQKVYEKARDDGDGQSDGAGITTLYQTMSQIVDITLKPLGVGEELCQQSGSIGYLLPLHIAAIFTVSYETLRLLLERYPGAANQKCNLEEIRTFIPNYSIPLELHNRLSTDFPKWEIEAHHDDEPEHQIQWTQSTLDRSYGTTGGMRRSDLMFAYYPLVAPYRHETPRIRRLESRIRSEVQGLENDEDLELSRPVKLLWEWMCNFASAEDPTDHYADSVHRVIQALPLKSVKTLASMPNQDGKPMVDGALPECAQVIQQRLDKIAETQVPVPVALLTSGFSSRQRSFMLREWDENIASRFCLQGRGFVGVLSRTIFNISDTSFPSNFVLLPYKLVKDDEGRLGLESAEAAAVAMKFADCLLHLTDPEKVLHFLEKKSIRFQGVSLGVKDSLDWDHVEDQTKEHVSKLLALYTQGPAYFYFLDEYTGAPIVPDDKLPSMYPLAVPDAADTVRKVLPLMISGMILMRGEKALPVLANVLLNKNVQMVHPHWIEAAKDLVGYLYSPQTEWTKSFLHELRPLRASLVDFMERGPSEDAPPISPNGLSGDWVVEISLVKMIVQMHDSNHSLCGLRARRAGLQVLWTREPAFLNPHSKDHLLQMDFKSLLELKEQSEELEEESLRNREQQEHEVAFDETEDLSSPSPSESSTSSDNDEGLGMLFRELSFHNASENEDASGHEADGDSSSGEEKVTRLVEPPALVRRKLKYASAVEPISLLKFDEDDMDLDDVLQLRILLDEQEAKLDFLRDKVTDLQVAELELLQQEDRLGEILAEVNNSKDLLITGPTNKGLASARKLLMRICVLEDRVLCREVEVGQLKNDISCFELDAAQKRRTDLLYDL